MKKTRIIDLFQTIKKTKTSWIAILIFILTSISFNFGLGWSDDMVVSSFDQEFHDYNTRDVELFSFYGLDENDISEIAENPDVEAAEGIHFTYADIRHDGNQQHVTVRELTENIDKLRLLEGRFPDKADEVVLDKGWAERNDIRTGDVIELLKLSSGEEKLKYDSLTVSGFVTNPAYSCSVAGTYGIDIFTGDSIDVMLYGKKEIFSEPDSAYQLILIKGYDLSHMSCLNMASKSSRVACLGLPGAQASAAADSHRNGRSASFRDSSFVGIPTSVESFLTSSMAA